MSGPSKWNFWSRYDSVVYGVRGTNPRTGRLALAYAGKTVQKPWTRRIEQHLFGGGRYDSVAKPWADTVPGMRPGGTVQEVLNAGGAYIIWRGRWSPMGLALRETLVIWGRRPLYNIQGNLANGRRITKHDAMRQRDRRDQVGSPCSAAAVGARMVGRWATALAALALSLLLLIPGVPTAVADSAQWSWSNPLELLILVVVAGLALRSPRRALRHKRR